jgi:hypothetical protein
MRGIIIFTLTISAMLAGCVTRIEGRIVNVTVSPATQLRAQVIPTP